MINLIKPNALKRGDKVATVSLSWYGAGAMSEIDCDNSTFKILESGVI